jgi:GR25 family glycosyltransferase involved in LPS biosynthesis
MFQNMSVEAMHQQLPVWIISLARATNRRQHMAKQIKGAGEAV